MITQLHPELSHNLYEKPRERNKGDKRAHQTWQPFSSSSLSFSLISNGAFVLALWHLPLQAYDQVVALTSVRWREIKHTTVRRHTRRIKLQLLTCDIKKPASIRHINKRDRASEREGREALDVMSEEIKAFQLLTDYSFRL